METALVDAFSGVIDRRSLPLLLLLDPLLAFHTINHGIVLWCQQYVDVTWLYLSIPSDPKETVALLNHCLEGIMGYMRANKSKIPTRRWYCLWGLVWFWKVAVYGG